MLQKIETLIEIALNSPQPDVYSIASVQLQQQRTCPLRCPSLFANLNLVGAMHTISSCGRKAMDKGSILGRVSFNFVQAAAAANRFSLVWSEHLMIIWNM